MKLRPMRGGAVVELLFGAIVPTLFSIPCLVGVLLFSSSPMAILTGAFWLLFAILPVLGISSLWFLVLFGPKQLNRNRLLRELVIYGSLFGIVWTPVRIQVDVFLWPSVFPNFMRLVKLCEPLQVLLTGLYFAGLVGSLIVWLRYLPSLWKGKID